MCISARTPSRGVEDFAYYLRERPEPSAPRMRETGASSLFIRPLDIDEACCLRRGVQRPRRSDTSRRNHDGECRWLEYDQSILY